ncbi:isoprenoid biosynthesis glyoxalase ElbB [Mycoplasmatota bacterium]|nr:isoprenoid biosynthesis glyoxalase ElbB [Mycoplasmatota bacterium]
MKYAVLLSGSGIGDGSQIEEAILTYLALEQNKIDYVPIAPNREQYDVINHFSEKIVSLEKRNILIESARIGKGRILPLEDVNVDDFDGLIIVGGMGVYKNLSNFMTEKNRFRVFSDVDYLIKSFYNSKKPIGAMCASVILVVKSLVDVTTDISVGMVGKTFKDLFSLLGINVEQIKGDEAYNDFENKLSNTPAFLGTRNLEEILIGLNKMLHAMKLM